MLTPFHLAYHVTDLDAARQQRLPQRVTELHPEIFSALDSPVRNTPVGGRIAAAHRTKIPRHITNLRISW